MGDVAGFRRILFRLFFQGTASSEMVLQNAGFVFRCTQNAERLTGQAPFRGRFLVGTIPAIGCI